MIRRIIKINEDLCNGCGACAAACHEGAIGMVDGKAVLLKDDYCDGLGDCLPACPTGAISFEEREAAAYDEAAVKARMAERNRDMAKAMDTPTLAAAPVPDPRPSAALPSLRLQVSPADPRFPAACPSGPYRSSWFPPRLRISKTPVCW